jgi:hypothetical protein
MGSTSVSVNSDGSVNTIEGNVSYNGGPYEIHECKRYIYPNKDPYGAGTIVGVGHPA